MQKKIRNRIRSIQKDESGGSQSNNPAYQQGMEFPKDTPGAIYVRQSSLAQVQKNLHSFEMQTEQFEEHFRRIGVTKRIVIIADDEGKSGTLEIHNREGLSRLVRLVTGAELVDGERIGWVGAVHVNRLTRDPWLITPGVLMKDCYENGVWIATLRMNFNFQDEYCQRVFMIEAEEAARHLKWMRLIMGGAKQGASDKGLYDGRSVMPGYIVDYREYLDFEARIKNPTYKKYIVYEPHARVVKWLFQRYLELDGNFPLLCREVEAMPFLFTAFEKWVDIRCISKFSAKLMIQEGLDQGCYQATDDLLRGILTNPTYLGWWVPMGGGLIENNHPRIVEEALFMYASKRLSTHDVYGNRQRPAMISRNGKAKGLLKKVITGPGSDYFMYINPHSNGYLTYACARYQRMGSLLHEFEVSVETLDSAFLALFLTRLQEWEANGDLARWKDRIEDRQAGKEEHKKQIRKSINEAVAKMRRINEIITDMENPPSKAQENDLKQMYRDLNEKRAQWEQELKGTLEEAAEEEVVLFQIWELIPEIKQYWEQLLLHDKLKVIGAFTRKVILSIPSPGWAKVEIEWKIGQHDILHFRRKCSPGRWTEEEDAILREMYPTRDGVDILRHLPLRTWTAIRQRAIRKNLSRGQCKNSVELAEYIETCLQDHQYAEEHGLDTNSKIPQPS